MTAGTGNYCYYDFVLQPITIVIMQQREEGGGAIEVRGNELRVRGERDGGKFLPAGGVTIAGR